MKQIKCENVLVGGGGDGGDYTYGDIIFCESHVSKLCYFINPSTDDLNKNKNNTNYCSKNYMALYRVCVVKKLDGYFMLFDGERW